MASQSSGGVSTGGSAAAFNGLILGIDIQLHKTAVASMYVDWNSRISAGSALSHVDGSNTIVTNSAGTFVISGMIQLNTFNNSWPEYAVVVEIDSVQVFKSCVNMYSDGITKIQNTIPYSCSFNLNAGQNIKINTLSGIAYDYYIRGRDSDGGTYDLSQLSIEFKG